MEEATGKSAKTIHRLLEYRPFGDELQCGRNEENPIDADVPIVDEFSMTDILLLENFFGRLLTWEPIDNRWRCWPVASVGAGNVLADMINSGLSVLPVWIQSSDKKGTSMIVVNAYKINNGEYPDFSHSWFYISSKIDDEDEVVAKEVVNKYVELIQSKQNNFRCTGFNSFGKQKKQKHVAKEGLWMNWFKRLLTQHKLEWMRSSLVL